MRKKNESTIDEPNLKQVILYVDEKSLGLKMVSPGNDRELAELKKLDKKGLTKFRVIDASTSFIAPKNIQQKLIDDFSKGTQSHFETIERLSEAKNLIEIHAADIWIRKRSLSPEQFQELADKENLELRKYKTPTKKKKKFRILE